MFQSTPSGGKATGGVGQLDIRLGVSIHAFRGEGDTSTVLAFAADASFNPRLPGGRRPVVRNMFDMRRWFQSTPSGGKATVNHLYLPRSADCFNPRLPGGRRLMVRIERGRRARFQSTPSGGKATTICCQPRPSSVFQSTPSGGKATSIPRLGAVVKRVSIHAFRGEGDRRAPRRRRCASSFNPRLPGGRRRRWFTLPKPTASFQSTPSGGKATRALGL